MEPGRHGAVFPGVGRQTDIGRIVVTGQTIEPGVPVPLFPTRIVGGGGNLAGYRHQYDVAPDGRFLINVGLESDPPPIRLLSNWKPRE